MSRMVGFLYKSLVIFMLGFLLVLYGFLSNEEERVLSPLLRVLSQGSVAAKSLFMLEVVEKRSAHEIPAPFETGGAFLYVEEAVQPGLTIITYFDNLVDEYATQLIDMNGNRLHQWRIPFVENPDLMVSKDMNITLSKRHKFIHGYHVDAEGNLLLVLDTTSLLKLNKNSELLWKVDLPVHHSLDVAEDGTIWVLSRRIQTRDTENRPFMQTPHLEDQVVQLSPEGEVLEKFSILDSIFNSDYEGILYTGTDPGKSLVKHEDPLHTNDIDILTSEQALKFDGVQGGDIMLSFRTVNTVVVLDKESKLIKWSMTGPFLKQHDPEIDNNGNMFIYDNRTGIDQSDHARYQMDAQAFGYTRILKIDPKTRHIETAFEGSQKQPFFSSIMGRVQVLDNSNLLIVEAEGGRVFEVDSETKDVVWEYRNLIEPGWVGRVSDADRYPREKFTFLTEAE